MKEFTNVAGRVTSFAGRVNFLFPSWISCLGAWFETFWDILWHHFHPDRVVSFKESAERGWKSGGRSLSLKSGWNPCTWAVFGRWTYSKTFFSVSGNGSFDVYRQGSNSNFIYTRLHAALRAADLDWIVGPGYSWGGCSQCLASCLRHSARISLLQCTFPLLCCVFHLLFRTFDVLLGWILLREHLFLENNIPISPFT